MIIFLDDILLMAASKEELTFARGTLIYLLQNLGFLINHKKSVLEPCQNIQFLGMEVNSIEMTLTLPREKREDCVTMRGSTSRVNSLHKGTKVINWLPCINSNCSSASTSAVSSHAATTNFRIGGNRGLLLKYNFICRSEYITGLVGAKSSFNQGKINNFCISSVNNSFRCFFKRMGSFLPRAQD